MILFVANFPLLHSFCESLFLCFFLFFFCVFFFFFLGSVFPHSPTSAHLIENATIFLFFYIKIDTFDPCQKKNIDFALKPNAHGRKKKQLSSKLFYIVAPTCLPICVSLQSSVALFFFVGLFPSTGKKKKKLRPSLQTASENSP